MPQYMQHAKALIMCSQLYETFGMVVIEAYSNGVPVIVGDMGNSTDLVTEGLTGVKFSYNSAAALKDAVENISNRDIDKMGKAAYQLFLEKYSMNSNYSRLKEIYNDTIRQSKNI